MKELAKQKLVGNWGMAIVTMLLVYVINSAASAAFGILELVISGPISIGLASIFLGFLRGKKSEFEDLFKGFNDFANNFVVGLLVYVFTFLWSLLLIIPGIIASYSYAMTFYIQHDHPEMRETEAITASKNMMKGHKWDLFVLDLSFIGWYLLVALTFGLLILYVGPYHQAARTAFYLDLIGEKEGEATVETPAEPFEGESFTEESEPASEEVAEIAESSSEESEDK